MSGNGPQETLKSEKWEWGDQDRGGIEGKKGENGDNVNNRIPE